MSDRAPQPPQPGASDADELAREFMEQRPRLLGIAYRLLGTIWDAEDIVADAMVRWLAVDRDNIREPAAFLTTMVTRRALDQLRSARVTRERYTGEWLPEPVATAPSPIDPLDTVERRESVSMATLRMMEQLTPPERAVFVLHEAFDVPHAAIADVLDISPASSRQHLHRARERIGDPTKRFDADPTEHCHLFERFLAALEHGDLDALQDLLSNDAVAYSDGGGVARAARYPIVGSAAILSFFGALRRHHDIDVDRVIEANGQPAALLWFGQQYQLLTIEHAGGSITEIHSVMSPDKLRYLRQQLAAPSVH